MTPERETEICEKYLIPIVTFGMTILIILVGFTIKYW